VGRNEKWMLKNKPEREGGVGRGRMLAMLKSKGHMTLLLIDGITGTPVVKKGRERKAKILRKRE